MAKPRKQKVPISWEPAPEVRDLARTLIEKHHRHLEGQPLDYGWRSVAQLGKDGSLKRSAVRSIPKWVIDLGTTPHWKGHERVFVIEIPRSMWGSMSAGERAAEVDKCLLRLAMGKTGIRLMDLSLYDVAQLVERHGLVSHDLKRLAKAFDEHQQQPELQIDEAA